LKRLLKESVMHPKMKELNKTLDEAARRALKDMLAQCSEDQQLLFKRMYSEGDLEKPIDDVVDMMPFDKLDWAMEQVGRTVEKNRADSSHEKT
jgi:hypothetical protein